MAVWKQALISLFVIAAGFAAWAWYYPGANEVLARWGVDWLPVASAEVTPDAPAGQAEGKRRGGGGPGMVVTAPVTRATINDRLAAIGTGRANQSVVVTPYAAGRMTEVLVESGAAVAAGDVIARLDAEAEEIALDRAKIALADAEARQARVQALRESNTATAVQVNEAELAVENARLAVRDAELALARRSIPAPIAGVVGILPVAAGNYVTPQTEIARIDDRSRILIDFWAPERYASIIAVGMPVSATSVARPDQVFQGTVSAIDNRIDEASRTLQVQASVANPGDLLRAGMSFRVTMEFPGDTYPAVDPLAVQWGADGAFVWSVEDGKAKRTSVRIIQRNTDTVLVDAPLADGAQVVTEGIHSVREGAPLRIAGQGDAPRTGRPAVTAQDATASGS
jgi:RND family efflux transporter MFP subunit